VHKTIISAVKRVEFVSVIHNTKRLLVSYYCSEHSREDKTDEVKENFYEELECVFDKFPKYHMKILLDFNAKVGREDIFKWTIGN
jgi:hypothetical protein